MTARCVEEDVLLRLLDGELTENEAERLLQHMRTCGVCAARSAELERTLRDLRAPLEDVDTKVAVASMMERLPDAVIDMRAAGQRPRIARRSLVGGLTAAMALTAIALAPRFFPASGEDPGAFTARGGPIEPSMARAVGVSVYRPEATDSALADGVHTRTDDAYAVRCRNLLQEPAYMLAFAVDAAGTVHWVCPAYLDPKDNPVSVALAPSMTEAPVLSAMQFEAPAPGPMRFVAILTKAPMRVHDVDDLRGEDLSSAALRSRWPTADIRELVTVHVDTP